MSGVEESPFEWLEQRRRDSDAEMPNISIESTAEGWFIRYQQAARSDAVVPEAMEAVREGQPDWMYFEAGLTDDETFACSASCGAGHLAETLHAFRAWMDELELPS